MKKITKKNISTTKTKSISKGTLREISEIKKIKDNKKEQDSENIKTVKVLPATLKKTDKAHHDKTVTTKTSKALKNKDQEYVMIEKSVTVTRTKTTFLDDEEEEEMFNEDWFGGSKLRKQNQLTDELVEEDFDAIIESFGKDDDKYW